VIDPELQAVLDVTGPADGPGAAGVTVELARRAHTLETEELAGRGPAVARVEDGETGGVPTRTYAPDGARGTLVYLHGGGWIVGDLDAVDAVCRTLAAEAGVKVVSVDYRLAPEHPFPAALEDALAVTRAARATAVGGDSAGGNLAAVVARRLREQLRFQLLVYPVTDAGLNTASYQEFDASVGLTARDMAHFWRLYLDGADGFAPDASPLRADDLRGLPAAYVLTASHDVLRDEGEAYAAALRKAGVPVELVRKAGAVHGFWRWQTTAFARAAVRDAAVALRAAIG
jgi:acetyl esterase